jgi:hypothetical protein
MPPWLERLDITGGCLVLAGLVGSQRRKLSAAVIDRGSGGPPGQNIQAATVSYAGEMQVRSSVYAAYASSDTPMNGAQTRGSCFEGLESE